MLLNIFRQTCINHHFELQAAKAIRDKRITIPTYLSLGTEHIPPTLNAVFSGAKLFAQHRCHSYYLSFGGTPELLMKELLGRKDGCNGGKGGSASVSTSRMFGHSGLLGDQIPIGVGYAVGSGNMTIVVGGDAAVEEDYALAAFGYAASEKAKVLFVIEDNDLSILTPKFVRRKWSVVDVARGFGMETFDVSDDPKEMIKVLTGIELPAMVNVNCCRQLWHAGAGVDGEPKWDRYKLFRDEMGVAWMEEEIKGEMEKLWTK